MNVDKPSRRAISRASDKRFRTATTHVTAVLAVAVGAVAFANATARDDSPIAAAEAAPQQDAPLATSVDLGGGFTANIDGTTAALSHPCPAEQNVATKLQWAVPKYGIETVEKVGRGSDNPIPIKLDFGRIYKFTCATFSSDATNGEINFPAGPTSKCVAFSERDGVVTGTFDICPTYSNQSDLYEGGDPHFGSSFLFPYRLGAQQPLVGLEALVGRTCEFGDTVVLSLDGNEVARWPANKAESPRFALPQLSGEHRLTTACQYSAPATPKPAQRGTCLTFTVTDTSVVKPAECNRQASAEAGRFGLRSDAPSGASFDGKKTTVVGGCGGYGFAAYTTSADGMVASSAAVARANEGDVARLTIAPSADPVGFFVGSCWTNLAGTVPGPLVCYHVVTDGAEADGTPNYVLSDVITCPFSEIRTAATS